MIKQLSAEMRKINLSWLWLLRLPPLIFFIIIIYAQEALSLFLLIVPPILLLIGALPYLMDFFPLDMGECSLLYNGLRIRRGEKLYREIPESKPPLIYLVTLALSRVKKTSQRVRLARFVNVSVHIIANVIICLIAWKLFGSFRTGLIAMILYVMVATHPFWLATALILENFVVLFIVTAFGMIAIDPSNPVLAMISGSFISFALLSKQTAIFSLVGFMLMFYQFTPFWIFVSNATLFITFGAITALSILLALSSANLVDMQGLLHPEYFSPFKGRAVSPPWRALSSADYARMLFSLGAMNSFIASFSIMGSINTISSGGFLPTLNLESILLIWILTIISLQLAISYPWNYALFPLVIPTSLYVGKVLSDGLMVHIGLISGLLLADVMAFRFKYRQQLRRVKKHQDDLIQLKRYLEQKTSPEDKVFVFPGGCDVYLYCSRDAPSVISYYEFNLHLVAPSLLEKEFSRLREAKIFIMDSCEWKNFKKLVERADSEAFRRAKEFLRRMFVLYRYTSTFGRYKVWTKNER